jgi:serine/threonine protein kinase
VVVANGLEWFVADIPDAAPAGEEGGDSDTKPGGSDSAKPAERREASPEAPAPEPSAESGPDEAPAVRRPSARARIPEEKIYGPYELLEHVARGGMAEVFKAKRSGVEGFEKVVAVKRILPHLSDNKEFLEMFVNEAKMVAGLTHPNIVQIFDLGKIESSYYIAMEFVDGRDLRTIQKRAAQREVPMPLSLCTYIVSRVCMALEYAHRKKDAEAQPLKIVHRDVSPQNILISFEGDVKLTDFGIAKAAAKASTTDRGALRGKLLFMSPEQAWGRPLDQRSDIFSLGVVFYELLAGRKPFVSDGDVGVLEMVRRCRLTPLHQATSGVPDALERVVMKALEREPDDRYPDAEQMHRDLERILHQHEMPTASTLAGYLEALFDPEERGAGPTTGAGVEDWISSGHLEPDSAGRQVEEKTAPGLPRDAPSIEELLRRIDPK